MKAIVYNLSIPKYVLTLALSRLFPKKFFPKLSCISLKEVSPPSLPDENWIKIKTTMSGICGSDMNTILGKESFSMEPYASFPAIMGHENIGTVTEKGANVENLCINDRVIVEPTLPCEIKNFPPCDECKNGNVSLCSNFHKERDGVGKGCIIGLNSKTGGGWGKYFVAHKNNVYKIPDTITDSEAVVTDSIVSALQPVSTHLPENSKTVLVYGCGILGINSILCLRALGFKGKIIAIYRHKYQGELAKEKGANIIFSSDILKNVAKETSAQLIKNSIGKPTIEGGVDIVFECIGSSNTIDNSLRLLKARGKLVLIATTGVTKKIDFCPVWFKEITIIGSSMYSYTHFNGKRWKTYELAIDLLKRKIISTDNLLTHIFSINDYKKAILTVLNKKNSKSVKVAFKHD